MKTLDEIKASMNKNVTNFVTWEPVIGDIIGGIFTEMKIVNTQRGERKIIVLENDEGTVDIRDSKVLRDEFQRLKIKIGDRIGIMFKGYKESNGPRKPMKLYRVIKAINNNYVVDY
jgi:hypothetical protein